MKSCRSLLLLAAALLLTGCQTALDRRIDADRETWTKLSDSDRHRLEHGHVLAGDSEAAVRIAFGQPDQTLVITGADGGKQAVWKYDILEDGPGYSPLDPMAIPHPTSRTQTVTFSDGVVVNLNRSPEPVVTLSPAERAGHAALFLTARLHRLVKLTPAQRRQAHAIYRQAQLQLHRLEPSERPIAGRPIRAKMRADIRTILTPEQRAVYDSAPPSQGGDGGPLARN